MIFNQKDSLQKEIGRLKASHHTIGFVPTMGALHQGHLSLVQRALLENDAVVVSIFVNPTQFDNASDLSKYPRTLEEDISLLKSLDGNLLIFTPDANELYGKEITSKNYRFGPIEKSMEGKFRSGHFDGVGTVLNLFFRFILPDRAYFGEKDFQQLQIVRKLVKLERLPITIVGCPITREANGLAMSSRNKRLTAKEFEEATLIHKTLKVVRKKFDSMSINKLQALVKQAFAENPHLKLEYFEITPIETLQPAARKNVNKKYRAFIAAFAGEVRLIDNMALN
jgi:pantoate--beta-alanine ligase